MSFNRTCLAATMCLVLIACGADYAQDDAAHAGGSGYALSLVGSANFTLHPSDVRELQVVLAQRLMGPVTTSTVHFEFRDGDPAGATLQSANAPAGHAQDVQTDANGVATVIFTAGTSTSTNGRPTFKVVATAPGYDAAPVAFSFNVIPVRKILEIVDTPVTRVAPDGQSATVAVGISTSTSLKVRELDQDTGTPIAGDTLSFILPPSVHSTWSGSSSATATAQTGAAGEAQVFLLSTRTPEGPFLVVAQPAAGGSASVNFNVTVQAAGTASCTSSQSCNPGQICVGGQCQDGGGGGTSCDANSSTSCPFGYICISGVCQPPSGGNCDPRAPACSSGQCCDPDGKTCKDRCPATACPSGQHCVADASNCGHFTCAPDKSGTPDVTGVWLTKHTYSIREALPPTVQDIFKGIRMLDQLLVGKLDFTNCCGLPKFISDWLNKLISSLLQSYLPSWLRTMIHIADDIVTVLSDLRSEGSMRLVKGADQAHVKGTEVWTRLVFYWLPVCKGNIGGDPDVPPDCARIDLATTDSENPGEVAQCQGHSQPSITVQIAPFTATVAGLGAGGTGPWQLNVDRRQVKVKMSKVVLVLVDRIIYFVTHYQYRCIEDATDCAPGKTCMVNCHGLGKSVGRWSVGLVPAGLVERLCGTATRAAGQLVTQALVKTWNPSADVLDFNGHASVTHFNTASGGATNPDACDAPSPGNCAGQIGNDNYDKDLHKSGGTRDSRDGNWGGDYFFKLLHNLPGAWEAKRPR
jgi:hypothetical protein